MRCSRRIVRAIELLRRSWYTGRHSPRAIVVLPVLPVCCRRRRTDACASDAFIGDAHARAISMSSLPTNLAPVRTFMP